MRTSNRELLAKAERALADAEKIILGGGASGWIGSRVLEEIRAAQAAAPAAPDFLFELHQLELLGVAEFRVMHPSVREPSKFLSLSIRGLDIKKGGILEGVVAHGCDPELLIHELFERLTSLPDDHYLVRDHDEPRRAFQWSRSFGSWVFVDESVLRANG